MLARCVHTRCARRRSRQARAKAKAATVLPHTLQSSTLPRPGPGGGPGVCALGVHDPGVGVGGERCGPHGGNAAHAQGAWGSGGGWGGGGAKVGAGAGCTVQSLPGTGGGDRFSCGKLPVSAGKSPYFLMHICSSHAIYRMRAAYVHTLHHALGGREKVWAARCNRRRGPGVLTLPLTSSASHPSTTRSYMCAYILYPFFFIYPLPTN